MMKVDFLTNNPDKINDVAEMIYQEFVLKAGGKMPYDAVVKHFANAEASTFPTTLIAIAGGECLGTVSIVENDLKLRKDLTPWLASLYTKPKYRGRGVAKALIDKALEVTRGLGYTKLYLRTEDASDYYRKRGWTHLETISDERHDHIDVFYKNVREYDTD